MNLKLTIIDNIYDNKITREKRKITSWDNFCDVFSKPKIVDDKNSVKLFLPIEFKNKKKAEFFTDDGEVRRVSANIQNWFALVIDVDGQCSIQDFLIRYKKLEFLLVTSHSHRTPSKEYKDCFRAIFPFKQSLSNNEINSRIDAIKNVFKDCDITTFAASRAFYLPSCPAKYKHEFRAIRNNGTIIDLRRLPENINKSNTYVDLKSNDINDEKRTEVLNNLEKIGMVDYDTWWKIAGAMNASGYSFQSFYNLTKLIRPHRITGSRPDNPHNQWKLSADKSCGGIGFLINLCKMKLGDDCFNKKNPSISKYQRTF